MTDRQRFDVEGTAPEQRRDAIEDARLVVDVNRECMEHMCPTLTTKARRSRRRTKKSGFSRTAFPRTSFSSRVFVAFVFSWLMLHRRVSQPPFPRSATVFGS